MQLMRRQEAWDPFREMEELSSRFNRLFGLGRSTESALSAADWAPSCDIIETDKEYRVCAELPNVKKEDVHVTLDSGILTIQGERREEKEDKDARIHRRELCYGHFMRRFTMPADADEANVEASFKDGILNVAITKSKAKATKAKEIAVH